MDVRAQVSQMSRETREALARRIRSRLSRADIPATDHDVSIVGGGVAALTLALEIRRARPTTRILVIEPNAHPVPEITHTVGESTVEVSAHYLRDRLGSGRPLAARPSSARWDCGCSSPDDGNTDIAQRMELGSSSFVPQVTYQIDRGRLENELTRRCISDGVEFAPRSSPIGRAGCTGRSAHASPFSTATSSRRTTARWVVDASGRNRMLPRQLDLKQANEHHCNAAWFRVATEIDVGRWSDDPIWQGRLIEGDRAMSTN